MVVVENGYLVNSQDYNQFGVWIYRNCLWWMNKKLCAYSDWVFQCKIFPHSVIRTDSEHLLKVRICFLRFWFIIMLLLSSQNLQFLTSHRHTRRTQKKLFCNRVIAPFQRKKKWFSFLSNQFNFLSNYHTKSARLMGLHATNPSIL